MPSLDQLSKAVSLKDATYPLHPTEHYSSGIPEIRDANHALVYSERWEFDETEIPYVVKALNFYERYGRLTDGVK